MNLSSELSKNIFAKTRDDIIQREFDILNNNGKGIISSSLSKLMNNFSDNQKEIIKQILIDSIDATLHELCLNLDENQYVKIMGYQDGYHIDMKEEHDENLVGLLLDAIDTYGKYNTIYDIVTKNASIEKMV